MTPVRLVGIGPGHPALITLQARDAIAEADAVRHQDGCAPGLLALARQDADVAPFRNAEEVIQAVRDGRSVAVLYAGDPYFFSNGAQLAMALEAKGFDPSAIRTRAGESRFTAADDAVLAGLAVLLLLCLWLRWNGYGVVEGVGF